MMKLEKLLDELYELIEERDVPLPEEVTMALEAVENDEIQGSDSPELDILGNYDSVDGDVNRLLEEVYDLARLRAEFWEFAYEMQDSNRAESPSFEILNVQGCVYILWMGDDEDGSLMVIGHDQVVDVEIYSGPRLAPDEVMEVIDDYMDG